jgi:F-type H+-transporting ATPase subunit b
MAIDAFTLIAQLVNFAVLLLLLRQFLFRPIQRVMAERERRIAAAHEDAERARADAEAQAAELRRERADLETHRRERLAEVEREVERARTLRLAEVRAEADAARDAWHADLDRQHAEVEEALRRGASAVLADALRRGWRALADEDLEARALATFARRLRELDGATRTALADAAALGPVVVTTAFDPTGPQREALAGALREALGTRVDPAFERDPELLAGVTLRAGDLRVGWSVRAHVDELERAWRDAVRHDGSPAGAREGEPTEAASAARADAGADARAAPRAPTLPPVEP